uniref:Uncharacterized protein n=1 Tax=Lotus japonicus TaxID=34305 RepID=I3RZU1_LOTJA|nr:unknown [Lotus japonicus]
MLYIQRFRISKQRQMMQRYETWNFFRIISAARHGQSKRYSTNRGINYTDVIPKMMKFHQSSKAICVRPVRLYVYKVSFKINFCLQTQLVSLDQKSQRLQHPLF